MFPISDDPWCEARSSHPGADPVPVLVCCDDMYHPGKHVRQGLDPWLRGAASVDWCEAATAPVWRDLHPATLVVLAKSNVVSAQDRRPWLDSPHRGLCDHVHRGGSLLVLHGGLAGYEGVPAIQRLAGGRFLHHPPICQVEVELVEGHALTRGAERACAVADEHYFVELLAPQAEVFFYTRSEHGRQPGGWIRREGAGRVCAMTPGHLPGVWLDVSFQRLLARAVTWLTQREGAA